MILDIDLKVTDRDGSTTIREFTKHMKVLDTTTDQATAKTKVMSSAVRGMVGHIFSLKSAIAGLVGTAGFGVLIKSLTSAASATEQYSLRLQTLLRSESEANRLFKDMADYAARVPHSYDKIMESATALSGVMKGGVDEVKRWMPLIGDLAAATGIEVERVTQQVIRMYSAGAASADLFRERGVLAMMGFQAGVSYSAEETRRMMMDAWETMDSQFRGATDKLGKSWTGLLSMMGDQWFQFRTKVMSYGVFDFMKQALGGVINEINRMKKEGALDRWAKYTAEAVITAFKAMSVAGQVFGNILLWIVQVFARLYKAFKQFSQAITQTGIDIMEMRRGLSQWLGKEGGLLGKYLGPKLWGEADEAEMKRMQGLLEQRTGEYKKWVQIEKDLADVRGRINAGFAKSRELLNSINLERSQEVELAKKAKEETEKTVPALQEAQKEAGELQKLYSQIAQEGSEEWLDAMEAFFTEGESGFLIFCRRLKSIFFDWGKDILRNVLKPIADNIASLFTTQMIPNFAFINPFTGLPGMEMRKGPLAGAAPYIGAAGLGFAGGYAYGGVGGGIGGAAGAGIGMAIGGPIGALIGGVGGSLLGGLFGKKKKKKATGPSLSDQVRDELIAGISDAFSESTQLYEFKQFTNAIGKNLFESVRTNLSRAFASMVWGDIYSAGFGGALVDIGTIVKGKGARGETLMPGILDKLDAAFAGLEDTFETMQPLWEMIAQRMQALEEQLGFNTKALEASKQVEDLLRELQFGGLAPVQSYQAYQLEYQRLLAQAQEQPGTFGGLSQFLTGSYLPFMQAYGGNYASIVEEVRQSVINLPWYQQTLPPINVTLQIDGQVLGNVMAEQIGTNPNVRLALEEVR